LAVLTASPRPERGRSSTTCIVCGVGFEGPSSWLRLGYGKICSDACRNSWRLQRGRGRDGRPWQEVAVKLKTLGSDALTPCAPQRRRSCASSTGWWTAFPGRNWPSPSISAWPRGAYATFSRARRDEFIPEKCMTTGSLERNGWEGPPPTHGQRIRELLKLAADLQAGSWRPQILVGVAHSIRCIVTKQRILTPVAGSLGC
jgi:hypothetical protein